MGLCHSVQGTAEQIARDIDVPVQEINYRDRPDLIERYNVPLDEYPRRCENQIARWESQRQTLENSDEPLEIRRSHEYSSGIIHSIETGIPALSMAMCPTMA